MCEISEIYVSSQRCVGWAILQVISQAAAPGESMGRPLVPYLLHVSGCYFRSLLGAAQNVITSESSSNGVVFLGNHGRYYRYI